MSTRGVPAELRGGPFSVADALTAGLSRKDLRSHRWRRVRRGFYVWVSLADDADHELLAVSRTLPEQATFSGLTAAWLHGLEFGPGKPLEVTLPNGIGISGRASLRVRRAVRPPAQVDVRGFRTTTIEQALFDLTRCLRLPDTVAAIDQALHRKLTSAGELALAATENAGRPGCAAFKRALELSDAAAESPMESRLRVLLARARLPRPESQVDLFDSTGGFLGRVDLYYRSAKLAVEYDGDVHRSQLVKDTRRQNLLLGAGYRLLRFTASDLRDHPATVVGQVRTALRAHRQLTIAGNGPDRAAPNWVIAGNEQGVP